MKILFISYAFYPQVGGIESSALLLLSEFRKAGHEVTIITDVELKRQEELKGHEIHRQPGLLKQWRLAKWADIIYYHNPAFTYWLPSLASRPIVTSIRTWVSRVDRSMRWKDHIKQLILSHYTCISNSKATAAHLKGPSTVIENAYDNTVFTATEKWDSRVGAAFVGRLVSDKGVATAIKAITHARDRGIAIPFKIIGGGPEDAILKKQSEEAGVGDLVSFAGKLDPADVAQELNRVKYLIIPSKWEEPFGIVALEGIACGCIPIGTNQGGLVDAIGPCGPLFEKEDANGLADWLLGLEDDADLVAKYRAAAAAHLKAHTPKVVADRYLQVFEAALSGR